MIYLLLILSVSFTLSCFHPIPPRAYCIISTDTEESPIHPIPNYQLIGVTMEACSSIQSSFALLIAGKVILNVGVGFGSATIPVYLSECAPASLRGAMVQQFNVLQNVGIIIGGGTVGALHAFESGQREKPPRGMLTFFLHCDSSSCCSLALAQSRCRLSNGQ